MDSVFDGHYCQWGKVMEQLSKILWPRRVENPQGGAEETAPNVLGEPDGKVYVLVPDRTATFTMFRGDRHYPPLVELLGADKVFDGDSVTQVACANAPDPLVLADVVAFERNGGQPAPGGGWERCDFTFSDGATSELIALYTDQLFVPSLPLDEIGRILRLGIL